MQIFEGDALENADKTFSEYIKPYIYPIFPRSTPKFLLYFSSILPLPYMLSYLLILVLR